MPYKDHNTQKGKEKNVIYMIPQELTKVVFCSNLCTHILILGFIRTLTYICYCLTYSVHFFVLMSLAGDAAFHAAGICTPASRPPQYEHTTLSYFGELQVDSELY